jgi:tetratricopeptide (TPR) repeat protein
MLSSLMGFSQRCNHANQIQSLYSQLITNGFDTKTPISYHYFFIDQNEQELNNFKNLLLKKNFLYVNTSKKNGKFELEVAKTEAHNANSATIMERSMSQLAKENNIDTFDGFELKSEEKENRSSKNNDFSKEIEQIPTAELFKKGIELYDKQEDAKALLIFDRCIKQGINLETSYYKRANCKTALGQVNEAIEDLENTLKLNPQNFSANFNLAGLFFEKSNYDKAANYYQKAVAVNPKSDNGFYRLAETYQKIGLKNAALQNCQKALQLNPANEYAKNLMKNLK